MAEATAQDQDETTSGTGMSAEHLTTTTRDQADLGRRMQRWLAAKLPADADPVVSDVLKPEGNGMSPETLLFTATWTEDGARTERGLGARIEPEMDKVPVFPTYDLQMQFDVISLVGEATEVAVPETFWYESDDTIVGAAFFVMWSRCSPGRIANGSAPSTFGPRRCTSARTGATTTAGRRSG